jgi:hypothetical protein
VSAPAATGDLFRKSLRRMLEAALRAVRVCEPIEGDRALESVDRHLTGAQLFILDTLYPPDEQHRKRDEDERRRRVLIRQRGLDELLMRVDRDAQRVSDAVVANQPAPIARIAIDMLLQGVVDLIDRVDVRALGPELIAMHPVTASRDPLVQRIVTLLHDERWRTKS